MNAIGTNRRFRHPLAIALAAALAASASSAIAHPSTTPTQDPAVSADPAAAA